jgi:hypothetical protein
VCWTAGLLRLVRCPRSPRWVWAATAAGGVVLATTRPSGLAFVVFIPLCVALGFGVPKLVAAARGESRTATAAGLTVLAAMVAAVFGQRYMPPYALGMQTAADSFAPAIESLPRTLREAVGRFAGDFFIPVYIAVAWGALLATLLVAAGAFAERRQRVRLALVSLVSVVFIIAYATTYLTSGFDEFYGRYALPPLAVVPLCAGAVLADAGSRMSALARRWLMLSFTMGTAAIQLLAWWLESRRLAVGTKGPFFFLGDATWEASWRLASVGAGDFGQHWTLRLGRRGRAVQGLARSRSTSEPRTVGCAFGHLLLADSHTYVCRSWGELVRRLLWASEQGCPDGVPGLC